MSDFSWGDTTVATILVIDDSATVREVLRTTLENAGHQVLLASNGRKGVDLHRALGSDLVITDLLMPEQEGLETIRELKRSWPDLPVIAASGGSSFLDTGDLLQAARCFGAVRTLTKPFTADELMMAIHDALQACAVPTCDEGLLPGATA